MDKVTGSSKGFGFIEMPRQGEAKAAMKAFNGKEIDGYKIRVKKAEEKSEPEKPKPSAVKKKSVWDR